MRRSATTVLLVVLGLVLTGCGLGASPIEKIDVTKGDNPEVSFKEGLTVKETETRVINKGDGDKLVADDTIKINYIALNGRTADEFDNSFKSENPMSLTLSETSALPGFYKGLVGQNVGSRVLVVVPPVDGVEKLASLEGLDLEKDDSMVFLFDVLSKVPAEAAGETKKAPANLPKVIFNDDNQPTGFKATKNSDKKLSKTKSAVLIKGTGPKVEEGQTVTAHYVGQHYPDGDIFDESWTTAPRQFMLAEGAVIGCWTSELIGQTIGSRVIVACSSEDAYGKDAKEQGRPEGALIFVVDLLDAI